MDTTKPGRFFDFPPFLPLQLEQNASFHDVVLSQLGVLLELRRHKSVKSEGRKYATMWETPGKRGERGGYEIDFLLFLVWNT